MFSCYPYLAFTCVWTWAPAAAPPSLSPSPHGAPLTCRPAAGQKLKAKYVSLSVYLFIWQHFRAACVCVCVMLACVLVFVIYALSLWGYANFSFSSICYNCSGIEIRLKFVRFCRCRPTDGVFAAIKMPRSIALLLLLLLLAVCFVANCTLAKWHWNITKI